MEEKIHIVLIVCNFISYAMALWEFFIVHSYEFGTILTVISILLNLLLYIIKNRNKIVSKINQNNIITDKKNWYKNYFYIITVVYIICNGLILFYSIFIDESGVIIFLLFIAIPISYSLLTLVAVFFLNKSYTIYGKIQEIIAPFPHYALIIDSLFIKGLFNKIVCIIMAAILYVPVCAVTSYVSDEIKKISDNKNV